LRKIFPIFAGSWATKDDPPVAAAIRLSSAWSTSCPMPMRTTCTGRSGSVISLSRLSRAASLSPLSGSKTRTPLGAVILPSTSAQVGLAFNQFRLWAMGSGTATTTGLRAMDPPSVGRNPGEAVVPAA
jgi:hypothetical protein